MCEVTGILEFIFMPVSVKSKEEIKSLLMSVKEETEDASLKLNIPVF